MKFIPEYYAITHDEYAQECTMLKKPLDRAKLEEINKAKEACNKYKKAVESAIEQAHKKFIEPMMHKNIIYSRTWGK